MATLFFHEFGELNLQALDTLVNTFLKCVTSLFNIKVLAGHTHSHAGLLVESGGRLHHF